MFTDWKSVKANVITDNTVYKEGKLYPANLQENYLYLKLKENTAVQSRFLIKGGGAKYYSKIKLHHITSQFAMSNYRGYWNNLTHKISPNELNPGIWKIEKAETYFSLSFNDIERERFLYIDYPDCVQTMSKVVTHIGILTSDTGIHQYDLQKGTVGCNIDINNNIIFMNRTHSHCDRSYASVYSYF